MAVDGGPTPSDSTAIRCLVIASFNVRNFVGSLNNEPSWPPMMAVEAPFAQVLPTLLDGESDVWSSGAETAVVWTRPEDVIADYRSALEGEPPSISATLLEVDAFADAVATAAGRVRVMLVSSWVASPLDRGPGMLSLDPAVGPGHLLLQMNLRLVERLAGLANVYLLDAQRWLSLAGVRGVSPKLWYLGKIAYSGEVFAAAASDVKAAVAGVMGGARKLLVVDLDDTLWGGIVGDIGWQALELGGHSPVGEAYLDLQRALKAFARRGILLAIASKNEQAVALEAIDRHPEMILRRVDFSAWRIDWNDKAANIAELAAELGLGLQSVVFIDDNPVERARVGEALPEVLVPALPADAMLFASTVRALHCFDSPVLSAEDMRRGELYRDEQQRAADRASVTSLGDWLIGLQTVVEVAPLRPESLQRTAQLLNKTNQMNLTTRRLTAPELSAWADEQAHELWIFRVSDRFGDAGLTGILGLDLGAEEPKIVDFVLSCRVMGRGVEQAMLATAISRAREAGCERLEAIVLMTAKNIPCQRFFAESGLPCFAEHSYRWSGEELLWPDHLERQ